MDKVIKKLSVIIIIMSICTLTACVQGDDSLDNKTAESPSANTELDFSQIAHPPQPENNKIIMGWVERVKVGDMSHTPKAKLDSGARTTSIDADIIRRFKRDGKSHIVFRVNFGDEEGGEQTLESPVKRWVKIKKKGGKEEYIRRPVVEMTLCIGGEKVTGEVNLADREQFIYPILIGRNMLKDNIIIDTSKTFTQRPSCE